MAKYTENFKLKKPEQTDFYNIDDFNGNADIIDAELKNAKEGNEKNEESIRGLVNPEFDDSGNVEGIGGFPDFLRTMVSKSNIFQFMRNAKAGFQFVLHAGQIVNNCVTDRADLPGSAAQLKVLMDLITKLNSDQDRWKFGSLATEFLAGSNDNDLEFLRVRTSDTKYHQLIADKDGIRLDSINGSENVTRWRAAMKSDLPDVIKISHLKAENVRIAPNAKSIVSIPLSVPSGYKTVAIMSAFVDGFNIMVSNRYIEGSNIKVNVRNLDSMEVEIQVCVVLLYTKIL